ATTEHLQPTHVNKFLVWLTDNGRKPETVKSRRRELVTLWRYAQSRKLAGPMEGLRTVKVPAVIPVAFLLDEISSICEVASRLTGEYKFPDGTTQKRNLWWLSHLNAYY